ncbi:MAG: LysR family transcriptional regulator [Gammaproteobacteria bacterium]|nr:LysR family transcriptional regulator [Gammaproteobacteria bacterium]
MHKKVIDLLKAMEVFVAVADSSSMSVAAERLHITQPAVSHHIKQLEREYDQSLLDRRVRPICLTAAGTVLRSLCIKLLSDVSEARSTMRREGAQGLNELRIAVIGSFLGTLVPDLVTAITEQTNIKRIVVLRGFASARDKLLKQREVDILITTDPMLDMEGLERYELFSEPFLLLLPAKLEFGSESLSELAAKLPLIRYTKRSRTGWAVETHLRRLRLEFPDVFEFDSNEDIVAMVAAGKGWAISTPSQVLQGMRSSDHFRVAPLPRPGFRRTTTLVVRSGELDALSHQIADLSCEVMRTKYLPRVQTLAPWLENVFHVGEAKH